jgi:hypothetical protein
MLTHIWQYPTATACFVETTTMLILPRSGMLNGLSILPCSGMLNGLLGIGKKTISWGESADASVGNVLCVFCVEIDLVCVCVFVFV